MGGTRDRSPLSLDDIGRSSAEVLHEVVDVGVDADVHGDFSGDCTEVCIPYQPTLSVTPDWCLGIFG
jgi:hypothetical protein